MFPLPETFLFPYSVLPLHVFEPRYREMVDHLIDRSGELVIATVQRKHVRELPGAPPVLPIAGLGAMAGYRRLEDGRYLMNVVGMARARIEEVDSPHAYRMVRAHPLEDREPPSEIEAQLRSRLLDAMRHHRGKELEDTTKLDIGFLADALVQNLDLAGDILAGYFTELSMARRAEMVLELDQRARGAGA